MSKKRRDVEIVYHTNPNAYNPVRLPYKRFSPFLLEEARTSRN